MITKTKKVFLIFFITLLSNLNVYSHVVNDDWSLVIEAIAFIESKHNPNIISPCGTWVGYLQISKIAVDECNQIVGFKKYKYSDRLNKEKSIEMFHIIQKRYNPTGNIEKAIRMWNGGPGYKIKSTNRYYKKVIQHYNVLKNKRDSRN